MIGTVEVRVTAGHPNMPLRPVAVFAGSAATIGIANVPRSKFGATITGVAVSVQNADGTVAAVAAVLNGGVWCATFGANHFTTSGRVENGITITASGIDEKGDVATWTIGKGDIEILSGAGLSIPGERKQFIRFCDSVPASPCPGDIASVDGKWSIYAADRGWVAIGSGVSMSGIGELGENCTMNQIKDTVNNIIRVLGCAAFLALPAFGDLIMTAPIGDIPANANVVTNVDEGMIIQQFGALHRIIDSIRNDDLIFRAWRSDLEDGTNALWSAKADRSELENKLDKSEMPFVDDAVIGKVYRIKAEKALMDAGGNFIHQKYVMTNDLVRFASKSYVNDAVASIDVSSQLANYATKDDLASVDVSSQVAPLTQSVNTLQATVNALQTYYMSDDVRVTITNYFGNLDFPALFFEQKMPADETHEDPWFRLVWDERTRWDAFLANRFDPFAAHVTNNLADRAWGVYDSANGGYSPDGFLQLSQENIIIGGGMAWQKTITANGAYFVLTANEPFTFDPTVTNGFMKITDADGTPLFEVVKGSKRTVGASASGTHFEGNVFVVSYPVASERPVLQTCTDLKANDWQNENTSNYCTVQWTGSSGAWVARITPIGAPSAMFAKASIEVGGNTYIKNHVAQSVDKVVIGGIEYSVAVETVNGKKLMVLTEAD